MERIKQVLSLSTETPMSTPRPSSNTLAYHAETLSSLLIEMDSVEFSIASTLFQDYLRSYITNAKYQSSEVSATNSIITAIAEYKTTQGFLLYLVLVTCLISIDCGDKVAKASRVALDVQMLPPDPDPRIFKALRPVLEFLRRTLRNTAQTIVRPLLKQVWNWTTSMDTPTSISGYRLFLVLFDVFWPAMGPQVSHVQAVIKYAFQSPVPEIRDLSCLVLSKAIKVGALSEDVHLPTLASHIMTALSGTIWRYFEGSIQGAELLVKRVPNLATKFNFERVPLDLLSHKEPEARSAGLVLVPFVAKVRPQLFTVDDVNAFIKYVVPFIKKKGPQRPDCALAFGKLAFALAKQYKKTNSKEIIKAIDQIDSDETLYAYLSVAAIDYDYDTLEKVLEIADSATPSKLMVEALSQLSSVFPQKSIVIKKRYLSNVMSILLKTDAPLLTIKVILETLITIKMPSGLMSEHIVGQLGNYAFHRDLSIRQASIDFLFSLPPSPTVTRVILTSAATEQNSQLRISLFPRLFKCTVGGKEVAQLYSLLGDDEKSIRVGALQLLKQTNSPESLDALSERLKYALEELSANSRDRRALEVLEFLPDSLLQPIAPEVTRTLLHDSKPIGRAALRVLANCIKLTGRYHPALIPEPSSVRTTSNPYTEQSVKESIVLSTNKENSICVQGGKGLALFRQPLSPDFRRGPIHPDDVDKLVNHLIQALSPHASKSRLDAAMDTLQYSLPSLDLHDKHKKVTKSLASLAFLPDSDISRSKLLSLLSRVGPVPSLLSNVTPIPVPPFPTQSPSSRILFSSATEALSTVLDVLSSPLLAALHTLAVEALLIVLKSSRQVGPTLIDDVLARIRILLVESPHPTITLLLQNTATLLAVLGPAYEPLVPLTAGIICSRWGEIDPALLVRTAEWLHVFFPKSLKPYIPQIVSVFSLALATADRPLSIAILSAFVSFGSESRNAVTAVTSHILSIAKDTDRANNALERLANILTSTGSLTSSATVVRTLTAAVEVNSALAPRVLDAIYVVAVNTGPSFVSLASALSLSLSLDYHIRPNFAKLMERYLTGLPCDVTLPIPSSPGPLPRPEVPLAASPLPLTIKPPPQVSDDQLWNEWLSDFTEGCIKSCGSRAVAACIVLSERHRAVRDALAPAAVAEFLARGDAGVVSVTRTLLENGAPTPVLSLLIAALDRLETAGGEMPVDFRLLALRAREAGRPAFAVRQLEKVVRKNHDVESIAELEGAYMRAGMKLAAVSLRKQRGCVQHHSEKPGEDGWGMLGEAVKSLFGSTEAFLNFDKIAKPADVSKSFLLFQDEILPALANDFDRAEPALAATTLITSITSPPSIEAFHSLVASQPPDARLSHALLCAGALSYPLELLLPEFKRAFDLSIEYLPDIAEKQLSHFSHILNEQTKGEMSARLLFKRGQPEEALSLALSSGAYEYAADLCASKDPSKALELISKIPSAKAKWSLLSYNVFVKSQTLESRLEALSATLEALSLNPDDPSLALRALTLSFRPPHHPEVLQKFNSLTSTLPSGTFARYLPQLLARGRYSPEVTTEVCNIASEIPEPLIFAVLAFPENDSIRKFTSETLPEGYSAASQFAEGLAAVARTWFELWQAALDDASRSYLTQTESKLQPLFALTSQKPKSPMEATFRHRLFPTLSTAFEYLEEGNMSSAWAYFSKAFEIASQFSSALTEIPLSSAAPALISLSRGKIKLPGSFSTPRNLLSVAGFEENASVFKSKQRPRKLGILSEQGVVYHFLLKGHEDLRLDERVMQLFCLTNFYSKLPLITYRVVPLSRGEGLIEWVPGCKTLYEIVKERRVRQGIPLEAERQATLQTCPGYDSLPLDQRKEPFLEGLKATEGTDLADAILEGSSCAESWAVRRKVYTESLAATSSSGYIIGLGDRHMSNIMMETATARLVHIDFGDTFEAAARRREFPEVVPFRLTRMMVRALEPTGTEGSFKSLMSQELQLFKEIREEVKGLLDAFICDPLAQWDVGDAEAEIGRVTARFTSNEPAKEMASRLIKEAVDVSNLSRMFRGWFPWW